MGKKTTATTRSESPYVAIRRTSIRHAVVDAIDREEVLRFQYGEDKHPRLVRPYGVKRMDSTGNTLVESYDIAAQDYRTFNLDKIEWAETDPVLDVER